MRKTNWNSRNGALLSAVLIASCSQAPTAPTSTSATVRATAEAGGLVHGSAAGDAKNGPIEIDLVRVSQTNGVAAFYAFANGEYIVRPGREVEIYVQIWTANPAVATPPRLIVDWGFGEADNIHCGPCRSTRTYRTEGTYTVKVTMDDRVGGVTSRTFRLKVQNATTASGTSSFSNGTPIEIPFNSVAASLGAASPYPSTVSVSGLGRIESATVTISGYTHTFHGDVIVLLVAPNGQTVKLMDDAGSGFTGNNATVTFQDGAPVFPSSNIGPGSFTFRPSQNDDTVMPAPAPNIADGTTLSTLVGIDPNGTWSLFVYDDASGDIGQIAGGWTLTLTTGAAGSSAGVQVSSAGVSASSWPNEHILNYPSQKPDPIN